MLDIFLTILPVFLILGAGYISVRQGYLPAGLADALNAFTVKLAVPVLLFRSMALIDFSQAFHAGMLVGFYVGGASSFALGVLIARTAFGRRPGEAVAAGFCALFSNTVLLGIPIMQQAYGETALEPVFGIIALHAGIMYTIGIFSMEIARADGRRLSGTVSVAMRSILVNPLMIGVIAGIVLNLTGLALPGPATVAVNMLAAAAIPAALVGLGAAITRYRVRSDLSESLIVTALSLIIHPLIAFTLTHFVFGLPFEWVRAAVVIAAMPPGLNVYIFASMYDRAVSLSASVIIVATTLSIFTISAWIWLLDHLVAG